MQGFPIKTLAVSVAFAFLAGVLAGRSGPLRLVVTQQGQIETLQKQLSVTTARADQPLAHYVPIPGFERLAVPDAATMSTVITHHHERMKALRALLFEKAQFEEREKKQFDDLIGQMNEALLPFASALFERLNSARKPTATETLNVASQVSGVLFQAQGNIDALVSSDRGAAVEPGALMAWNYVDLEALREGAVRQENTAPDEVSPDPRDATAPNPQ